MMFNVDLESTGILNCPFHALLPAKKHTNVMGKETLE
jgi:hypothetical protein